MNNKLYKEIFDKVYNFKTKNEQGFTGEEIDIFLKENYPDVNRKKFDEAMWGNTCMVIDNKLITYHCDVEVAIRCGLENRDIDFLEWD